MLLGCDVFSMESRVRMTLSSTRWKDGQTPGEREYENEGDRFGFHGQVRSRSVVCGLALRKADGDDTVQWPPRRSATRNNPVPAVFLTPSPPPSQSPNWPSAGRTTSAGVAGERC